MSSQRFTPEFKEEAVRQVFASILATQCQRYEPVLGLGAVDKIANGHMGLTMDLDQRSRLCR